MPAPTEINVNYQELENARNDMMKAVADYRTVVEGGFSDDLTNLSLMNSDFVSMLEDVLEELEKRGTLSLCRQYEIFMAFEKLAMTSIQLSEEEGTVRIEAVGEEK